MGAKTWMLIYSTGNPKAILKAKPVLDREATLAFARRLFPSAKLEPLDNGSLSCTCPPQNELVVGCFPGLTIVAARQLAIDHPSRLPPAFVAALPGHSVYLHAMHSVVDWFAYAIWKDGKLERSLSVSPDSGQMEDIGERLPFEEPYWAGQHPASDPGESGAEYPLVFHPLELAEAALLELFGYQLEGFADPSHLDPDAIGLMRFKRSKSWWRWW